MTTAITVSENFSEDQVALIKRTICKDSSDDELNLFVATAARLGLDPFARQIFAVMRNTKHGKVMSIQVSIDGYRLAAERTGKYQGQCGPFWCGDDGEWKDVWLSSTPPKAAKVGVYKTGAIEPTYATARWDSYNQDSPIWRKMPDLMLAKCAEGLALRKMFPAELSGVYVDSEMPQNDAPQFAAPVEVIESGPEESAEALIMEMLECATVNELNSMTSRLAKIPEGLGREKARKIYAEQVANIKAAK